MSPALNALRILHLPRLAFLAAALAAGLGALPWAMVEAQAADAAKKAKAKPTQATHKATHTYAHHPEAQAFIREMVERHGFVERELQKVFAHAQRQPAILEAIKPPSSPRLRSWSRYRAMFVNEGHLAAGARFASEHAQALARAEQEYGVPAEIVVAIIGIETYYGRNTGKWRIIDALSTLAFDYPPRAEYFRSELEAYLLFVREADLDVMGIRGSYAGAIGIPQFMPNSYRRWAVDFDGDGTPRLRTSPVDAIGSVANFLRQHGWVPGEPIAFAADPAGADAAALLAEGIKPQRSLAQLAAMGVAIRAPEAGAPAGKPDALAALIELETPDAPAEYRVGLQNFFTITRYNRSSFYASAVMDLAAGLRSAVRAARP